MRCFKTHRLGEALARLASIFAAWLLVVRDVMRTSSWKLLAHGQVWECALGLLSAE